MHGLINRSFENFLRRTYGPAHWQAVIDVLDPGFESFEPMLHYDDALTTKMLEVSAHLLAKPSEALLEDFGTSLVADRRNERVRRLLRFGGVDYADFLHSLDDLPGRVRLAVSDLHLPQLDLTEEAPGDYRLVCHPGIPGYGHVMLGVLRALADDYGALVYLERRGQANGAEVLSIRLLDAAFSEGRDFSLFAGGN